jgi:phage recombination protein Bet
MNAITTTDDKPTHDEVIRVLENSLYPGAKRESIELVLAYCRTNGLDPMLRPVYIVPTSVKKPDGTWETRDVLMPGIADYRIKAARSGEYGGKSEPEFGPDVRETLSGVAVAYPAWCRITVRRIVQGQAREFVATERWLENYATAKRDTQAPNAMWKKRPYGQLAKVAEAQALRMAFPEFSAGYTMEEMQGKTGQDDWSGPTIDADAPSDARKALNDSIPLRSAAAATPRAPRKADPEVYEPAPAYPGAPPNEKPERTEAAWRIFLDKLRAAVTVLHHRSEVVEIGGRATVGDALAAGPEWVQREISSILAEAFARLPADETEAVDDDLDEVVIAGEDKILAG